MPKVPSQVALSSSQTRSGESAVRAIRAEDFEDSRRTAELAAVAAFDKKADDVLLIDLRGVSGYADFLVVVSGTNERQLEAIADGVEQSLREQGHRLVGAEGGKSSRWQLLDFGDVVVHVFHEDERHYYDLEGLWADAPRIRIDPPRAPVENPSPMHA
jgi:ribosome-associated protein